MAGKLLVLDTVPKYTMSLFPKSMRNAVEVSVFRRSKGQKRWCTPALWLAATQLRPIIIDTDVPDRHAVQTGDLQAVHVGLDQRICIRRIKWYRVQLV